MLWEKMASQHLARRMAAPKEVHEKPATRYRAKCLEWLIVADAQLESSTGRGLSSFVVPPAPDRPHPSEWRCLTISLDQGADGYSACNFLVCAKSVGCLVLRDDSHRKWNDCKVVVRDASLSSIVQISIAVMNADHAPWGDAKLWCSAREAVRTYLAMSSPETCPMFQWLYPEMVKESGDTFRLCDDSLVQEVWGGLGDVWDRKIEKVGSSRWFGYKRSMERYATMWSRRLLIMLYLCLSQGRLKNAANASAVLSKVSAPAVGEDPPKENTGEGAQTVHTMRALCGNTLELCAVVLGDPNMKLMNRIICRVMDPVDQAHSAQNRACRSSEGTRRWYAEQAAGAALEPCLAVLRTMRQQECGFSRTAHPECVPAQATVDSEHPAVIAECHFAGIMAEFALALCKRTLFSAAWHLWGYPGRLAGLLIPEAAGAVLADMAETRRA